VALSEPGRHWKPALPTKAHSAGGGEGVQLLLNELKKMEVRL
jgi:hypothetical protein